MPALRRSVPLAGFVLVLAASVGFADATSDAQKKAAAANLQKAEVSKAAVVETENLIVATSLPETKAKALAATLQKTYTVARKGLRFEPKEEPWKGKLTVYYLPDRKEFDEFMRAVAGERTGTRTHVSVRGDEPYAVSGAEPAAKATDADIAAEVTPLVGAALLQSKVGANNVVPAWVRSGFGRAAALRAEGPSGKRFPTYKAQARATVLSTARPTPVAEAWGERPDADLLGTSLMDYMAFGAGSANFPKFLSGLRPDENGDAPPVTTALESAGWKTPELDVAWKRWVQGGMVAK